MEKILAGIIVGIFVGALAVEILNRKRPELTRKIEEKAKIIVDALIAAPKEGLDAEGDKTKTIRPEQSPA